MANKKTFRLFSKKHNVFYHGDNIRKLHTVGREPRLWKTFASLISKIENEICRFGFKPSYVSSPISEGLKKLEGLEIVEYEIILKEVKRYNVKDVITERQRVKLIENEFGWQIAKMYLKINQEELKGFKYILPFKNFDDFDIARERLKELDIMHGRQYRYNGLVIVFNDLNDAILCKLTFADKTLTLYDLETLKELNVEEEEINCG